MQFLPYILIPMLVVLFIGLQLYPYFKLRATRGHASPLLAKILQPGQSADGRILLYFMAPQCGMCRATTPVIDEVARQRADVIRIDASVSPDIAREFRIMGTPAFVLLKDGVVEQVKLGAISRSKILAMLDGM